MSVDAEGGWVEIDEIATYANEIQTLRARVAELEGAASADHDRLLAASQRCGGPFLGCDTPDSMADQILRLRALLERFRDLADVPVDCPTCKRSFMPYIPLKSI